MAKKKVKTDEVVINSRYSIWPVANGFILKPETGETSYGREIGFDTYVFNSATDMADFIDNSFKPLKEIK